MTRGRLLDLVQPEVDPYNMPTQKTALVPNMWIAHYSIAILKLSQLKAAILFPASKLYSIRTVGYPDTKSSSNVLHINSDVM